MERQVKTKVTGFRTQDGAGVSLVRVLGNQTAEEFDPILMLDSFDSINPDDYTAGFPLHPHRGIETISYTYYGSMVHKDSLGNEDAITDGEVQWMNSGSGILHEEAVPTVDRLLGVQLWLNLPASAKMSQPGYHKIRREEIEEIPLEGGYLRLLAGQYEGHTGYQGQHLPLDYYDVHLEPGKQAALASDPDAFLMIFTLSGDAFIAGERIPEKTAVKLSTGDRVSLQATDKPAQILFIQSKPLQEPIAWAGPIVMNTQEELKTAFAELRSGHFIKSAVEYGAEAGPSGQTQEDI